MKKYPKYKDSGVDWLGEIPSEWEVWKVSRLFKQIGSGTTPKSGTAEYYENGTIPWVNTGDLNNGYISDCSTYITQKAFNDHSTLKIYEKGTLLVAMYGATIGKIAITKFRACTNQACCSLVSSKLIDTKFAFYWFLANKENIINLSYGGGQPNISQDVVKHLHIPICNIPEQLSIVRFLDHKTGQIDRFIASRQKQIELLKEQKAAIINKAVTKGIDPQAKMKPSGIEWLPEVPVTWDVWKMKFLTKIETGNRNTEDAEEDGAYPFYVRSDNVERISSYSFEGEAILTAGDGVGVAKVYHYANGKMAIHQRVYKISHFKRVLGEFLYYYIKDNFAKEVIKLSAKTTVDSLRMPMLANFPIAYPSMIEQQAILDLIKIESTTLDTLITKYQKQIGLMQEYRTALISQAVTGKIDVRENV